MKVKYLYKSDGEKFNIDNFPNFHKSGSATGMKKLYYGKNALLVKCGSYIYNVTDKPYIYHQAKWGGDLMEDFNKYDAVFIVDGQFKGWVGYAMGVDDDSRVPVKLFGCSGTPVYKHISKDYIKNLEK